MRCVTSARSWVTSSYLPVSAEHADGLGLDLVEGNRGGVLLLLGPGAVAEDLVDRGGSGHGGQLFVAVEGEVLVVEEHDVLFQALGILGHEDLQEATVGLSVW